MWEILSLKIPPGSSSSTGLGLYMADPCSTSPCLVPSSALRIPGPGSPVPVSALGVEADAGLGSHSLIMAWMREPGL
jgi:hypothetical protein